MPQYQDPAAADALRYLRGRTDALQREVDYLRSTVGKPYLDRGDHEAIPNPSEGQVMVNYLTDQVWYYSRGEWRQFGSGSGVGIYEIKLFEDDEVVFTGDLNFGWMIPPNLDQAVLVEVYAFVTTNSSSGAINLQVHNITGGVDMLSTALTVDSGEPTSLTAAVPAVIDTSNDVVTSGDLLRIDVDGAGTGAKGLGFIAVFLPAEVYTIAVQGQQGPAGGITAWTGAWDSGTTYTTNESISHNGSSYAAVQGSTDVEPGVDSGWEDYWQLLATGVADVITSEIVAVIDGAGGPISTGIKGYIPVPFDCTIVAARLLADQSGSIVVDIWKDAYANHPPTGADSITASTPPTLSSEIKSEDVTLTGWTTSITAGDVLGFNVDSSSTLTFVTVALAIERGVV